MMQSIKLRRIQIALAILISLSSLAAVSRAQDLTARVDAKVSEYVGPNDPGVAVLIMKGDKILIAKGYGKADLKSHTPVTADSVFDLASLSKQFTAVAVLMLVEAGQVQLDKPVSTYIKDFKVKAKGRAVTVRDLLQMTSGLEDYTAADWDGREKEFAYLTTEGHLKWLNETGPATAPGIRYSYNNTNYVLLALLVERVSGQSFSRYMKEEMFAPAGMTGTFIHDRLDMKYQNGVTGYKGRKAPFAKSSSPAQIPGDGNVFTTIKDMAKWVNALRTNRLISARTHGMAWSAGKFDNGNPVLSDKENGYNYGFGWEIDADTKSVFHSGSWDGTSTYFLHYRQLDETVVVLSNNESLETDDLAVEIGELF